MNPALLAKLTELVMKIRSSDGPKALTPREKQQQKREHDEHMAGHFEPLLRKARLAALARENKKLEGDRS
jgi:hypothetical protein